MSADDHQAVAPGPLGGLPRVSIRQVRLESRLDSLVTAAGFRNALDWLSESLGSSTSVGRPEISWRPAGLRRAGVVAQFAWPRLSTRLAVGVETPLAHAIVDRLLGYDRLPAGASLPPSPVEWGILTYAAAETMRRLSAAGGGPFGAWDLILDRVGPDPFEVGGLGQVVTVRWPLTLGTAEGSIRLWMSEALVARWLTSEPPAPSTGLGAPNLSDLPPLGGGTEGGLNSSPAGPTRTPSNSPFARGRVLLDALGSRIARVEALAGDWKAEAGTIALPRGLKTLRNGGVLPLTESQLLGTPQSPSGAVVLVVRADGHGGRYTIPAEPVPLSGGGRLTVTGPLRHDPTPREAIAMTPPPASTTPEPSATAANDVPVTLVVELGRLNLTLGRLADLKPGDVVELGRHSREPVELTSGGRLVARGELVLIDTELGVRVTHLFL